jgi:muconolactone delta-isomerase
VWRTDEVTPLLPHPNDPGARNRHDASAGAPEFLITFTITIPDGTPADAVRDMKEREARRAHELAEQGHLVRLWRLEEAPTTWRSLGLWRADDAAVMQAMIESLPMYMDGWINAGTLPLARHPNDPALTR